jgi:hypothetical protein
MWPARGTGGSRISVRTHVRDFTGLRSGKVPAGLQPGQRASGKDGTLENWQTEFLAVGTIAVLSIYLRQRGSPESKPVGAPHDETGSSS